MKNFKTLLLGIATIAWPVIIPGVAWLIQLAFPNFRYVMLAGITVGWFFFTAIFVYATFHAMKNPALPTQKKTRWMMYLLLCNVIAVPLYWYRYIWQAEQNR